MGAVSGWVIGGAFGGPARKGKILSSNGSVARMVDGVLSRQWAG
jgi:hypothetical protein